MEGLDGEQSEDGFRFRIVLGRPNAEEKQMIGGLPLSSHGEGHIQEADHNMHISPLDPTTLSTLLSRLPEPNNADDEDDPDSQHEDAIGLRDASLAPPPKSGMLLPTPFPPPPEERAEQSFDFSLLPELNDQEKEQKAPPLSITRFTPAKQVVDHMLTSLTLTFSQPMVALSSIATVEAETVSLPISLSPQVDGSWRWFGTQTIQFEAKHRFPFSTTFTLTVAQGCKSAIGGILRSAFSHTFSTLPPSVVQWSPSWIPKSLSPLFLLLFNQRISPSSILSHICLSVEDHRESGGKFVDQDFELIEEPVAEKEWPEIIKNEVAGMWVAFKLREKFLERSTSYVLSVPSGCPSAEGNLTSTEDWSTSFSTYGPLVITSSYGYMSFHYGSKPSWNLTFSNELDHTSVSKSAIHVSPSIEAFKVIHTEGTSTIVLQPVLKSDATYVVTLDSSIKDVYGQHLDSSKATAEFKSDAIEPADGFVAGPASMVVLNPSMLSDPFISLTVFNFSSLRIQVFQVDVEDYRSPDLPSSNSRDYAKGKNCAVGKGVYDQEVELEAERDEPHEHKLFLGSLLQHQDEHFGQLLVIVEPTESAWRQCQGKSRSYNDRDVVFVWVQCTQLSLDVFPDQVKGSYTAWVSSLENGAPIGKATVRVGSHRQDTDEDGLAVIVADAGNTNEMIVVQKGMDITFMPDVSIHYKDCDSYGWYVFDSRGLYKPTEEVHIKGHIRKLERKKNGGHQPVFAQGHVNYVVHDARGNKLTEGDAFLNKYGSFFFTFSIPDNANLGDASISLEYKGQQKQESSYQHRVNIQEFRKPEFEITTTHLAPAALYMHSSRSSFVIASTSAKYYAGGPLTGAEVRWSIQPSQTRYTPPGHMHYRFGSHDSFFWRKWGYSGRSDFPVSYPSYAFTGKTGFDGKHEIKIEFRGIEDCPSCISVSAHSSVIDINNQVQESATTFLVHPSFLYVGFKLKETFGRKGEEVKGEVVVCDVDGKLVKGVEVKLTIRGQGKQEKEDDAGLSIYEDVLDEQTNTFKSDEKPVEFLFVPRFGGVYSMVFSVADSEQRHNDSRCNNFFVSGGYVAARCRKSEEFIPQDEAELIPNKDMYEAGETAVLLIQSPFWPAEGLLIMKCGNTHVGEKVRFRMLNNTHTITAHLDASWIPAVEVQVLLVGVTSFTSSDDAAEAKQLCRPAFAVAQRSIKISSACHKLAVDITPMRAEETATPGGIIHVSVKVKKEDHGEAVGNAEISLIVVDEAILNLASYTLSDPLSSFYPTQYCDTSSHHLRKHCLMPEVHLIRREMFCMENMLFCKAGAHMRSLACMPGGSHDTIKTRSNFNPLAAFIPSCITDAGGLAELTVELPDNLTRYRIWVVASTETQFGLAESSLTVQLPVMIRPSPPRFLNLSDKALISVVLQNQTKHPLPLLVGMQRNNARVRADNGGYFLTLPSFQRAVVYFPVLAVDIGKARLQFVTSTSAEENVPPLSDASEVVVPVFTPVSSEFFAMHGDVAEKEIILQPIKCPSDAFPQFGGLDVSISSTTLQSLTDALLYLYAYPFECNEQLASRIIGFLSLWEVLEAFNVKDMPSKEKMSSKLNADLQRLKDRQLSCGGWSWWTQEGNSKHQPFISLHVACALVKASKVEVLKVDTEMFENSLGYCADIETYLSDEAKECGWLPVTKYALLAYALYIRALSNKDVGMEASALLKKASLTHLTLEACGWILIALGLAEKKNGDDMKVILDHIKSQVVETGEHAYFTASYKDDGMSVMLHSNRRTDAILLEALLITEPSSTLCAKVAKGLQAHRKAGKWSSTQENCFVLVALNRFFAVYEKEEPNFTANVWMGEQWVMSHTYSGRSIETKQARVLMPALLSETKDKEITQLIVQKKGGGRLYYRVGLGYAPRDFQQKAASYGFSILRSYEGVDSPMHAVHDTITKVWKFKVGEKIRVKLRLGTMVDRYHVAMVDSLPAGCEPINSDLERSVAREQDCCMYAKQCWVEHENMRDERVEAFCSLLGPGQYEYCYVLRATCKGEFVIPPAKVEEMYTPENFGRCASEKVIIN